MAVRFSINPNNDDRNNNSNNSDDDNNNNGDEEVVPLKFKAIHNVKVIKGLAMRRLSPTRREAVNPKAIIVKMNGKRLKDTDKLVDLDFAHQTADVTYPEAEDDP